MAHRELTTGSPYGPCELTISLSFSALFLFLSHQLKTSILAYSQLPLQNGPVDSPRRYFHDRLVATMVLSPAARAADLTSRSTRADGGVALPGGMLLRPPGRSGRPALAGGGGVLPGEC